MTRKWKAAVALCAAALGLAVYADQASGQKGGFGTTLKGRVVWAGKIPERAKIDVKVNPQACGNAIIDENIIVNEKNNGVQGTFVWLVAQDGAAPPVHANLQAVPKDSPSMDQPKCMFIPRSMAIREGQTVLFKNTSQIPHNVRTVSATVDGNNVNVTLPAGGVHKYNPKAQDLPVLVQCDIHGWMKARIAVFDHPYFAVTDANGNFEIKLPPAGKYRLKVYHEYIGWRGGAAGKDGQVIEVKAGGETDVKDLEIGKAKKK